MKKSKNLLSNSALLDKQLSYWVNNLSDMESLNLPLDKQRPQEFDYSLNNVEFKIDSASSNSLRLLAQKLNVSLYSLTLSCFNLMLSSYSNQNDIVVGTPVANRHHNQLVEMVGLFVNSLVIRSKIDKSSKVVDYIREVGNSVIQAQLHQDLPFERLVSELKLAVDAGKNPIFQVMFSLQDFAVDTETYAKIFIPSEIKNKQQVTKFDLTVMLSDSGDELQGNFNYVTSLFHKATIERFIGTYVHILKQVAQLNINSSLHLNEITYITPEEYKEQIYTWNNTKREYPQDKTIQQLFEEQVLKTPDNIAVMYEDRELSYQELNRRSNQLAHYLRSKYDLHGDDLMALCLDRSEHMIISILGVLKAGCAYVPIDPSYPLDRISYILDDTKAKCLLVNEANEDKIKEITNKYVVINSEGVSDELAIQSQTNPKINITSKNLAYVIYTSGTTGKPKGVMIEHTSVVNYIQNLIAYSFDVQNIDFSSNFAFDLSITTNTYPICCGKTIHIYPGDISNIEDYINYLVNNNIEFIKSTPSFLSLISSHVQNKIKFCMVGGEKLTFNNSKSILKYCSNLLDEYGPTETTVGSMIYKITENTKRLTIGKPYNNFNLYILDSNLRPLPIGAIGELYIGGDGLARGYLNRDDLTTERFISNPFASEEDKLNNRNSRIYKTGDLVRYREDGNIEYIGRNDDQVKIRGFRIELAEIENVLSGIDGVKQAVVITRVNQENGSKYLVAYYVSNDMLDEELIRNELGAKLPEYMVPSAIVHLTSMPLTINGKLDKRSLPEVSFSDSSKYVV